MKSIIVLSGKGGVGKSSIVASLAISFSKDKKIVCADCDVDASNLSLLFSLPSDKYEEWNPLSTNQIAIVDKNKCIGCGACADVCPQHAVNINDNVAVVNQGQCSQPDTCGS